MKNIFLFFFFLISFISFGQTLNGYAVIDAKMAAIPAASITSTTEIAKYIESNFKTDSDRVRASFYWTASTISYDVANMFDIDYNNTIQEKISGTLKSKKGVCIHYAEIFNDINSKMGIQSYVID
jgi:transglutaminase-like putative cysteine protease